MWFLLKPVELKYKTHRPRGAVIDSLNQIASFKGDTFNFPFRVIGNSLYVKPKLVRGHGKITTSQDHTIVAIIIQPATQLKMALVLSALLAVAFLVGSILVLFTKAETLAFIALLAISLLSLSLPRMMYFFALEMRKSSIESLILGGK